MAKQVENEKGFLVIEMTGKETHLLGGRGICDWCGSPSDDGFYVAVLNNWYCPRCYDDWCERSVRYTEDIRAEKRNFNQKCNILGIDDRG